MGGHFLLAVITEWMWHQANLLPGGFWGFLHVGKASGTYPLPLNAIIAIEGKLKPISARKLRLM
jgi:hypothetical protein